MTLYLVSTPIGNLSDITLRGIEILNFVDIIASEDTRKTSILLKKFDISKPQISFYEYNEEKSCQKILKYLKEGKNVALVTNAGTPSISDPGFTLVRTAIEEKINITMVPGASACIMALVLSGLPVNSFIFKGFPPRKAGKRINFLKEDSMSKHTLVFYESPHRLVKFLEESLLVLGDRKACVCIEMTKKFERIIRGFISELIQIFSKEKTRGEITIVISGINKTNKEI